MTEDNMSQKPFWESLSLAEMSTAQWESLCDGCGKCCLVKLRDDETGNLAFTDIACRQLDCDSCQCIDYDNRLSLVDDCVKLNRINLAEIDFMPASCAYRLLHEGKKLPDWHPLVSGSADSVHEAGKSVRGRVVSERALANDLANDLALWEDHIVAWPEEKA
jgi:uncharacterized cysteine cluster protein YcgN (CxxCxxCC family)